MEVVLACQGSAVRGQLSGGRDQGPGISGQVRSMISCQKSEISGQEFRDLIQKPGP